MLFCGLFYFGWDFGGRENSDGYDVPTPRFKASKRVGTIMYGLWYGRITVDQAREMAARWGFDASSTEDMIYEATEKPSYWWHHSLKARSAEQDGAGQPATRPESK